MAQPARRLPEPRLFIPKFVHAPKIDVTMLPNGWGVAIIDVTPDLALEMLARNYEDQRHQKAHLVRKLASDITGGRWELTHQGIAFDMDGTLYDGQHRLQAVVTADKPASMLVFFGVGKAGETKEAEVIDTHGTRTLYDAATMRGTGTTRRRTVMLNQMISYGVQNGKHILREMTQSTRLDLLSANDEVIAEVEGWIGSGVSSKKLAKGPVLAAIGCAAYHVHKETLRRFVMVFTEQVAAAPGEGIAKTLRQFIYGMYGRTKDAVGLYLKTCKAIQHFQSKTEIASAHLYACQENPFPFPLNETA